MSRADFPNYDRDNGGNVFEWIMESAAKFRKIRQQERLDELEKIKHDDQRNAEL